MGMLSGPQIREEVRRGTIAIDPFHEAKLNPNSYDLSLDNQLKVYEKNFPVHTHMTRQLEVRGVAYQPALEMAPLDMKAEEATVDLRIDPDAGLVLWPGVLYLACTIETAGSDVFVPSIEGRSSVGRLGLCVHMTAGFGDLGYSGPGRPAQWTCEITVVHPLRVYTEVALCQIVFQTPHHETALGPLPRYAGKYTGARGPKASGLWKDFKKG